MSNNVILLDVGLLRGDWLMRSELSLGLASYKRSPRELPSSSCGTKMNQDVIYEPEGRSSSDNESSGILM